MFSTSEWVFFDHQITKRRNNAYEVYSVLTILFRLGSRNVSPVATRKSCSHHQLSLLLGFRLLIILRNPVLFLNTCLHLHHLRIFHLFRPTLNFLHTDTSVFVFLYDNCYFHYFIIPTSPCVTYRTVVTDHLLNLSFNLIQKWPVCWRCINISQHLFQWKLKWLNSDLLRPNKFSN